MKFFFVAGIGIALFIEFLLISKKNKSASDKILTVWMFVILVHLFGFFVFYTGDIFDYPFLLGIEQPIPLFHGVLLFLYVSVLTKQLPQKRILLVLHFLPIIVTYAFLGSFFTLSGEQKLQIYRLDPKDGKLSAVEALAVEGTPGALAVDPHQKFLFASL